MLAAPRRRAETAIRANQPRADAFEPPAEIERAELPIQLLTAALAHGDAGPHQARQHVRQLRSVPSAHRQPRGKASEGGPPRGDVDASAQPLQMSAGSSAESISQPIDSAAELDLRRYD